MDEILIDEKRYISSKQAAKITGYAKDYIGQLCREGRVPARLVGRSWYVLETAIQDHRFGADDIPEEKPVTFVPAVEPPEWETPRYETVSDEFIPSVNRIRADRVSEIHEKSDEEYKLEDTWKDWFDRVTGTDIIAHTDETVAEMKTHEEDKTDTNANAPMEEPKPKLKELETTKPVNKHDSSSIDVPLRAIYSQPPQELLPHSEEPQTYAGEDTQEEPIKIHQTQNNAGTGISTAIIKAIQAGSICIAIVAITLAIVGTGLLDAYIISNSQVQLIAGVIEYNK
jgi:hypothetical protein